MPRESEIISMLRKRAGLKEGVLVGIGDDGAVIQTTAGSDLIACCDLMVEGVHFRSEWTPAKMLGWKALAVNLSDVAAMGGVSKFAMISIAIPHKCSSEFVDEIFGGIFELADASGVSIIGGDTSGSRDSLFIDISVIGECQNGKAVSRRGAKIGNRVYVSGSLGASAIGLKLLEGGFRLDDSLAVTDPRRQAVLRHLAPEPRLRLGRALGEAGIATSMIDISDGLSTDLWHILDESNCGAVIHADAIPVAECVRSLASEVPGIDPLRVALNGGEDYELLFTAPPENNQRIAALAETLGLPIKPIGEIVALKQLQLDQYDRVDSVQPSGYEHVI